MYLFVTFVDDFLVEQLSDLIDFIVEEYYLLNAVNVEHMRLLNDNIIFKRIY